MNFDEKKLVSIAEEDDISRKMMVWANSFTGEDIPAAAINYEFLPADSAGMKLSVIPGTYITQGPYILGGYEAAYRFAMVARIIPGNSNDKRLRADAMLNRFGEWATKNYPSLGDGIRVRKMEISARATMLTPYEDGSEDHQILMKMTYEVI